MNWKNILHTVAGSITLVQLAVNANTSFPDPYRWIVPLGFTVALYILGNIAGNTPAPTPPAA